MTDHTFKNKRDLRRQHNAELIRRMRNGESLTSFDSKASWYPPRPIIQKDKAEMARLYGSQGNSVQKVQGTSPEGENVVKLSDAFPQAKGRIDDAS